jgi:hypothetical protein
LISIAFALALAAAPAPGPAAGACALLQPAACADAGQLARDPGFQAALRQFVGKRVTAYLSTGGTAYAETLTALSGPADPARRLRNLYLFTACANASCDDQGAAVLQPDGELAAVAIVHGDCGERRRAGDCVTREVLSILRGPDDDLSIVEALSDWAQRGVAARPIVPGTPIRGFDRVEVIALAEPDTRAQSPSQPQVRPAPVIALPRNPQPAPAPPTVAAGRPAPPPPVRVAQAQAPKTVIPPPRAEPPAPVALPPPPPVLAAAPPLPVQAPVPVPKAAVARAEPPPADAPVTSVEGVVAVAPRQSKLILAPIRAYLTPVRTEPRIAIIPPPPPPPPKPKKPGWQFHATPYDCRSPARGRLALGPVPLDPLAGSCKRWQDDQAK